jgi:hypothetical protein
MGSVDEKLNYKGIILYGENMEEQNLLFSVHLSWGQQQNTNFQWSMMFIAFQKKHLAHGYFAIYKDILNFPLTSWLKTV